MVLISSGNVWISIFSIQLYINSREDWSFLTLVWPPVKEKENFEFRPVELCLKLNLYHFLHLWRVWLLHTLVYSYIYTYKNSSSPSLPPTRHLSLSLFIFLPLFPSLYLSLSLSFYIYIYIYMCIYIHIYMCVCMYVCVCACVWVNETERVCVFLCMFGSIALKYLNKQTICFKSFWFWELKIGILCKNEILLQST